MKETKTAGLQENMQWESDYKGKIGINAVTTVVSKSKFDSPIKNLNTQKNWFQPAGNLQI